MDGETKKESGMICSVCNENNLPLSETPGYEKMCIACESQDFFDRLQKQWNEELSTLNKRTGLDYDFDLFVSACWGERGKTEINKSTLIGLSALIEVYEDELVRWKEYNDADPYTAFRKPGEQLKFKF